MRITNTFFQNWPSNVSRLTPQAPVVRIALLALAGLATCAALYYFRHPRVKLPIIPPHSPAPSPLNFEAASGTPLAFISRADLATPLSSPATPTLSTPTLEKDSDAQELRDLYAACKNEWPPLTFDEIINTKKDQLERVLAATPQSDFLKKMLLLKVKAIPAAEILQKCPELFKSGYFKFYTQKDPNSPTFRQCFENEVTSYEEFQTLEKAYGPGIFSLGIFSPEWLNKHVTLYVYDHHIEYLQCKLKLGFIPVIVRHLANKCWKENNLINEEYLSAVQGKEGVEKDQLDIEVVQKTSANAALFKEELKPFVELLRAPKAT